MKRVFPFLLLFLSLTAPIIHAQGDDPEPLDVTETFDNFQISYPEGWKLGLLVEDNPDKGYYLVNDPNLQPVAGNPLVELTDIMPGQNMIAVAISHADSGTTAVLDQGLTLDYYLGILSGIQLSSLTDDGHTVRDLAVSDRVIGGLQGRSALLATDIGTFIQIVYIDHEWDINVTVGMAPGERDNPTIDAILDSIKLVDMRQKIGRLKQNFEGDLSGISMAAGTPVAIVNEVEAQEITRDGITSNIWYEIEEICGTQSALMWSGAIQLEEMTVTETTYLDYCIEYVHDPELPQEIIDDVKLGFRHAYLYAKGSDVSPKFPVTVEIYESEDIPPYCGYTEHTTLTMYVDDERCPLPTVTETAVHEFLHIVQFALLGEVNQDSVYVKDSVIYRGQGPDWLFEGMAIYLMARIFQVNVPNSQQNLNTLSEMEPFNTVHGEIGYYTAGYAVSLLVDGNDQLLFDYYRSLGQQQLSGEDWKTHFESTFGISVEDFYAQFE